VTENPNGFISQDESRKIRRTEWVRSPCIIIIRIRVPILTESGPATKKTQIRIQQPKKPEPDPKRRQFEIICFLNLSTNNCLKVHLLKFNPKILKFIILSKESIIRVICRCSILCKKKIWIVVKYVTMRLHYLPFKW